MHFLMDLKMLIEVHIITIIEESQTKKQVKSLTLSVDLRLNALPQPLKEHSYGLKPEWIVVCRLSCSLLKNFFLQSLMEHSNGLSPMWLRLCMIKLLEYLNFLPHREHECG